MPSSPVEACIILVPNLVGHKSTNFGPEWLKPMDIKRVSALALVEVLEDPQQCYRACHKSMISVQ
jgi:hypothetical protein